MNIPDWIALAGVFPASVIFLIVFSVTRSPWWRSPIGWVMFGLAAASVLTYSVIALTLVLGRDYWGRDWIRGIAFALLALAYIAKTAAVIRERRHPHNQEPRMSNIDPIVPAASRLAAKRAFWRTTLQGYEALLYVTVGAQSIIGLIRGEIDMLVLGVNVAVAVAAPPLAGLRAAVSIVRNGIPEDYETAALAKLAVLDEIDQQTDLHQAVRTVEATIRDAR